MNALLTYMPAMVFAKDAETGVYVASNQSFAEYAHKEDPSGVVGLTDHQIFDKATADHFVEDDKKALSMDEPHVFIEDVPDAAGYPRHFQTTKVKFTGEDGKLCSLGLCVDVTVMTRLKTSETERAVKQQELKRRLSLQEQLEEEEYESSSGGGTLIQRVNGRVAEYAYSGGVLQRKSVLLIAEKRRALAHLVNVLLEGRSKGLLLGCHVVKCAELALKIGGISHVAALVNDSRGADAHGVVDVACVGGGKAVSDKLDNKNDRENRGKARPKLGISQFLFLLYSHFVIGRHFRRFDGQILQYY